jgi:hypothetical protein
LIVNGILRNEELAASMIFSNLPVLSCVSKVEPAPLAQTPSIGHPMLMSMKSHWTSFSISSCERLLLLLLEEEEE